MSFYAKYPADAASSGVTSLNSMTGALTLVAGSNITITPGSGTLTIAASGGGSGANTALSNLIATAINEDLIFDKVGGGVLQSKNDTALTGDISIASGDSSADASGNIFIGSGNAASGNGTGTVNIGTAAAVLSASGSVLINTGGVTGNAISGVITIASGDTDTAASGAVTIVSGDAVGNSGIVTLRSGDAPSATSGVVNIKTGSSDPGNNTGNINILTGSGTAAQASGALVISSGSVLGNAPTGSVTIASGNGDTAASGAIILQPGTAGTTRGKIKLVDGSEGNVGEVWTSTNADGSGNWAPAAGGSANTQAQVLVATWSPAGNTVALPFTSGNMFAGASWNASLVGTNHLVAQKTGIHKISFAGKSDETALATNFGFFIKVNGTTSYDMSYDQLVPSAGWRAFPDGEIMLDLTAGDTIELFGDIETAGSAALLNVRFSIEELNVS